MMIGASTGLRPLSRLGCLCPDWDDLLPIMAETLFRQLAFLREMRAYLCRVREVQTQLGLRLAMTLLKGRLL
jgi:hypothetical protein